MYIRCVCVHIQLNTTNHHSPLLSGQSNAGVSSIMILTTQWKLVPSPHHTMKGVIHAGLTLYQGLWNVRSRFSMWSGPKNGSHPTVPSSYFEGITKVQYARTARGWTNRYLQENNNPKCVRPTFFCRKTTPRNPRSIDTIDDRSTLWKILQYISVSFSSRWFSQHFAIDFLALQRWFSQLSPGSAPHETLQGRWSPATAPRKLLSTRGNEGETSGDSYETHGKDRVNHGIGMSRMG